MSHGPGTSFADAPALADPVHDAVRRGRERLLGLQQPDGHWVGELQGDTILESEYVLLLTFLGHDSDPLIPKCAAYLRGQQTPGGAWACYPGGPADLTVSVKAYFALKIAGDPLDAPHMLRAARVIRSLGGAERVNSFTKFYLALLGQLPYSRCPSVPAEMILLPLWFPLNIYQMSAWTRTIVVPLAVFDAHKPVRRVPAERGVRELFVGDPDAPAWPAAPTKRWFTWTNFFLAADAALKWCERRGLLPLRRLAVSRCVAWMRDHGRDSDGVGAIFPPMIYTAIVLRCLGVADDDPEMRRAMRQLRELVIEEGDTARVQPCLSPVWDTALTLLSLCETDGRPETLRALGRGVDWLLDREVRGRGDWSVRNPDLPAGGWFFEYNNAFYPDTDDTAMVLMALARTGHATAGRAGAAVTRAKRWLLGLQNKDGGWAAFDRDITQEVLTKVPFADHNAMLDPSCPDITGRVLEALGEYGWRAGQTPIDRALRFLERTQEPTGAWFGRWGVNYVYGTWQVLAGLELVGYEPSRPAVRRAADWLEAVQQAGGGWGESCRSYDDPQHAGQGEPTASQTAWALLGLMAAGRADSPAVRDGVEYLLATQREDGSWDEEPFTGTGFPRVFYLKYHMYPDYFPLMALAKYRQNQD